MYSLMMVGLLASHSDLLGRMRTAPGLETEAVAAGHGRSGTSETEAEPRGGVGVMVDEFFLDHCC